MAEENPWKEMHIQAETDYQGGGRIGRHNAEALVNLEYRGTPDPRPCPAEGCDGTLHWRATVGSMMCVYCRRSESSNGVKVYNKGGPDVDAH